MAVIGLDLGGTKLAGACFDDAGNILLREVAQLGGRTGKEVGMTICELANYLISSTQSEVSISAIGLSVPGIAYVETGTVWAPNIPGWDAYPIVKELKDSLVLDLPVFLDSDRSCYILGEAWKGKAKDCKHAIYMAVGTGIGIGVMIDGRILRGKGNIAGAIGWMALNHPYHEKYDACGCFEYHASGAGLARVARELLDAQPGYGGPLGRLQGDPTSQDVFIYAAEGDSIAQQVLDEAIVYWGMAIANLVSIFNPESIILGGGVFGPASQFLDQIQAEAKKWAQPISIEQVKLEVSELGGNAGLIGAGYLALRGS